MVGDDDVNLSLLQEVDAGLACRIGDADGYIRVEFVELLDIRHQKIAADGIAGAMWSCPNLVSLTFWICSSPRRIRFMAGSMCCKSSSPAGVSWTFLVLRIKRG